MNKIISVIGLGYVGIPLAVEFAKKFKVIGFDISEKRIHELQNNYDRTGEITAEQLQTVQIDFTSSYDKLREANFHIVAVPTPIDEANQPDITLLLKASESVGRALKKGDIVVFESTVYPGCTEEDCVPVMEKFSKLKCGIDFKVGYSPERINPGDKEHTFTKITKVVSGMDQESLDIIANTYAAVVTAGVYKADSIKIAEASKVIENTQRDLNIAFVNELSLIFKTMGIDTLKVLEASGTKWNFLRFYPGLVGGHCIGVDPFYLTHKAEKMGYHPHIILAGRRVNDSMGHYVAQQTIELLIANDIKVKGARVNVLGLTFKENCPDVRNTRVVDIVSELKRLGIQVDIYDPLAHEDEIFESFKMNPTPIHAMQPADAVIIAASHSEFRDLVPQNKSHLFKNPMIFVDVKGLFKDQKILSNGDAYWHL